MTNQRCLVVRLTKSQHERVKMDTQAHGYKTMAQYARSRILEFDNSIEKKIEDLHRTILGPEKKERQKGQSLLKYLKN